MGLIGYSIEDIESDPTLWQRIIHPDDRERVVAAHAKSNAEGRERFSMEYRIVRKGGQIIWVQDQAALARLNGNPPYWQGFLLDVTERKIAEDQLARALEAERDAAQRLRALDEMKNTFLQAVSHDLRTPLAAILGLAVTLERGDVELERRRHAATSRAVSRRTPASSSGWSSTCSTWTASPEGSSRRSSSGSTSARSSAGS